jgi:Reverse transcriptase (RNA-dependent DNA polymerase)
MQTFLSSRELMNHLQKKNSLDLLQIDFSKAFDMQSWEYQLEVMRAKGFPALWISWIKNLLISSTSHIIVNGVHSDYFYHQHGLRQGDPLSLLFFILATDVIQLIIYRANELFASLLSFQTVIL